MFGGHRKLMRGGQPARAVVTVVDSLSVGTSVTHRYRLGLRVYLDDGSTVDATCRVGNWLRSTGLWFTPGDIVPVRYDRADHRRVAVDEPELRTERAAAYKASADEAIARSQRDLAGRPEVASGRPQPTDEQLQASYGAWRVAVAQAKQSKAAHKRAQGSPDRRETQRLFNQSMTHNAEERSARTKLTELRKLRPDWTPAPTD